MPMERLYDTMVQEVFELTGYNRVMAYKFHDDDDHSEVVSEITKPGLKPYLGLHYPATDIPQAVRFLFMKNKVRMIYDCRAKHMKVLQDDKLQFDLTLCGSTLRAPHSCHLQYMENMNSIASLVMAVVIKSGEEEATKTSWVPDPVTGYYRPENKANEIDIAGVAIDNTWESGSRRFLSPRFC
ncbi:phytochrome A-like [Camellia sinensis]|uniref:phytochrome A-like n=1 Tax=Camellia sinensis TaxID=4442 RepID=UPI0010364646|nr:phytochrome A-like [Camellia sinensis]